MAEPDYSTEEWRVISGFPDYAVSDHGRVRRSVPSRRGKMPKVLKLTPDKNGYLLVSLYVDERIRQCRVHVLVCDAFNGPQPSPRHQVAHGDGNPAHNRPHNVRWATARENADDRERHKTVARGERNGFAKLGDDEAREILADRRSYRVIAAAHDVCFNTVSNIKRGASWRHLQDSRPPA